MKKIWKRLLVLCGIFILAASAFALYIHFSAGDSEEELEYEVWGSATLPIVASEIGDQRVNLLHGYTMEVDDTVMEDTVMPVEEDGLLPLTVLCYDSTVDAVRWILTTRDGSETVTEQDVEELSQNHETATMTLDLSSYLTVDEDYRLQLILSLSDGTEVFYYTRVRMGEELHAEEMLGFALSFHEATFDEEEADYTGYLEYDGTADEGTLADVTIHSSFNQLTWGDLNPVQTGELSVSVLEIDGSFGSFLLEYEVEAEDEEGNTDTFLITEAITVQWSSTRFYLMNYHRTMTELFEADDSRLENGTLDLGILSSEDVETATSEGGDVIAFTAGGELWSYDAANALLTQVFTFRDDDDGIRSGYRRYDMKILEVGEDGNISFLVYGYMNRGQHEGQLGVSYLTYEADGNTLNEIFFLSYEGTRETLKAGIETLACVGGDGQMYLLMGDSLYSIDWEGGEVVVLVDSATERNLTVNDSQTAVAWEIGENAGSVQILYLDNGDSQLMEADTGDCISPQGFIGEDCILGLSHEEDTAVSGALSVNPYYAIVIKERDGEEAARYEYEDIYISSVTVDGDQVILERLKKDSEGGFSSIDSDTLIQSNPETTETETVLSSRTEEVKLRTWTLSVGTVSAETEYRAPELVSYASGDSLGLPAISEESTSLRYYAFSEGELTAVASEAGSAIAAVYEAMGTVIDSEGHLIWTRTGRDVSEELSLEESAAVSQSEALENCLEQILSLEGMELSLLDDLDTTGSSLEILTTLFPDRVLNLSGCTVKALLYYVDRGCPVLLQDREGTVLLLVGYDQYNVTCYDPTQGGTYKLGQQDAAEYLESGEFHFVGLLPLS
ncbi:MAG: hypothetical protein LUE23_03705 [Lachnospiraceae bacterium]|nr:hypothetical protein [Lachnospiraceae bacterium]